jgi:hypothetical protein
MRQNFIRFYNETKFSEANPCRFRIDNGVEIGYDSRPRFIQKSPENLQRLSAIHYSVCFKFFFNLMSKAVIGLQTQAGDWSSQNFGKRCGFQ